MKEDKLFSEQYSFKEKQYRKEELLPLITKQLDTGLSFFGKTSSIEILENNFKNRFGLNYCFSVSSGTAAISTSLFSIGITTDDEIISAVYGYWAILTPILQFDAIPVFIDTDLNGNISLKEIRKVYSKKTKAILINHSFGHPNIEIKEIVEFAKKNGIYVIEDCSQAYGAKLFNDNVGSYGDICLWSLQERKLVNGGEGGIIGFKRKKNFEIGLLYAHNRVRTLHEVTSEKLSEYKYTGTGNHFRLSPINAIIANWQLNQLNSYIEVKRIYAKQLDLFFSKNSIFHPVFNLRDEDDIVCSYHLYPILIKSTKITPKYIFEYAVQNNFYSVSYGRVMNNLSQLSAFKKPISSFSHMRNKVKYDSKEKFKNCNKILDKYLYLPVPKIKNDEGDEYIKKTCLLFTKILNNL